MPLNAEYSLGFLCLVAVASIIAFWGLLSRSRIFEYPVVVSLFVVAWIIPQGIYIERMGISAMYSGATLWYYAIACLLALTFGFYLARRRGNRGGRRSQHVASGVGEFDLDALRYGAIVLVSVGSVCSFLLVRAAGSEELTSQWTGVITAYALGMETLYYGLALAFLLYLRRPSAFLLIIMAVAVIGVLPPLMAGVKRAGLFELVLIFAAGWFFTKKKTPPRIAVVLAFLLGTVVLHQVGSIRGYVKDGRGNSFQAIVEGVPFRSFEYTNLRDARELHQAVFDVWVTSQTLQLEWGAQYWNTLVHQYVPAFLVGKEMKDAIKIERFGGAAELDIAEIQSTGVTRTGFSDTYRNFWIFGTIVFLALGWLFGVLYIGAVNNQLRSQFYYIILLSDGLQVISHSSAVFVAQIPFLLLATHFIFLYAARRRFGKKHRLAVDLQAAGPHVTPPTRQYPIRYQPSSPR
jgi:hypothetical protein